MAALREKMFRMRFLKIAAADFLTWNLSGDGENGNAAAVAIVKPIDQMQVAGPTTSRADREVSGKVRFRARGKRRRLFVSDVGPSNLFLSTNRVGDSVQGVARNSVNPRHARLGKSFDQQVRYSFFCHQSPLAKPKACDRSCDKGNSSMDRFSTFPRSSISVPLN
jgi:hypothetical protein